MTVAELQNKANDIRKETLEMCIRGGTGHVTSSFSCAELLTSLYFGGILNYNPKEPSWAERDRFILSKGQASPILYVTLAEAGFFPKEWLLTFCKKDAHFGVHLQNDVPGVEYTTGSLGHGLGIGAGVSLAAKMNNKNYHTIVMLGDAECYEGSVWEAAMFIGHHKLNNIAAVVDRNGYGVLASTEEMVRLNPLDEKFRSFGWETKNINGHSIEEILNAFKDYKSSERNGPLAIIANTVKGKGISFMENVARWHGIAPTGEYADRAREELENYRRENEHR
ncbi:MAG: transketolase [Candidatus Pacearchaeota archaeon]